MAGPQLLKEWRSRRGFTQEDAAPVLGISQSALCDYEKGNKTPRISTAAKIARATEGAVPVESWLTPEGHTVEQGGSAA